MAIKFPLFFRNALERLRPIPFAEEVSALTTQAFHRLHRLGTSLDSQVNIDLAMALSDERRKAFQDEANRHYIALFDTLIELQILADSHKKPRV
jgi:hypothetical protein